MKSKLLYRFHIRRRDSEKHELYEIVADSVQQAWDCAIRRFKSTFGYYPKASEDITFLTKEEA